MLGRTKDIEYESRVREVFGDKAEQRFALDEMLGELLALGWRPKTLAMLFQERSLDESIKLAGELIEEEIPRASATQHYCPKCGQVIGTEIPCVSSVEGEVRYVK